MLSKQSPDVTPNAGELTRKERWLALGYGGATVWLTGLPAAGKSTIGAGVEKRLVARGRPSYLLDGDNLRHGLNGDLGFSRPARSENARRSGHVACLLADAGIVAVVALISPYADDRDQVRELHETAGLPFIEVWIATPLAECERRDPKGLYARARGGDLRGLTGVDDPYEPPPRAELIIEPHTSIEAAVDDIVAALGRVGA